MGDSTRFYPINHPFLPRLPVASRGLPSKNGDHLGQSYPLLGRYPDLGSLSEPEYSSLYTAVAHWECSTVTSGVQGGGVPGRCTRPGYPAMCTPATLPCVHLLLCSWSPVSLLVNVASGHPFHCWSRKRARIPSQAAGAGQK